MHRRSSARRPPDPYAGDVTVDCLCRGHSLAIAGERVLGGRQFGLRQNARQTARIAVAFAVFEGQCPHFAFCHASLPRLTSSAFQLYNVILIMLGEFEYLILAAASALGEEAYGAAIRLYVEQVTGRRCSIGALYTTLDRLEIKGLIKTRIGESTPQRGGRPKRMVRLTALGVKAATEFYSAVIAASRDVSWEISSRGGAEACR